MSEPVPDEGPAPNEVSAPDEGVAATGGGRPTLYGLFSVLVALGTIVALAIPIGAWILATFHKASAWIGMLAVPLLVAAALGVLWLLAGLGDRLGLSFWRGPDLDAVEQVFE